MPHAACSGCMERGKINSPTGETYRTWLAVELDAGDIAFRIDGVPSLSFVQGLRPRPAPFMHTRFYCPKHLILLNLHSTYLQPVLKVPLHRCSCSLDYSEVPGP